MQANPITPTVPYDEDGVHHGFLRLPFSRDDSAWGHIMIPISVIRHGEGPTALLTGGSHGDEYEGPIALQNLAMSLAQEEVTGRIIIVPAFNYPAFCAASRTSPIDKCNLNRIFPGRPDGTATEKIADYFQRTLIPLAHSVLDFHSGGKTLDFLPFAANHILPDKAQQTLCAAAMHAFNAPFSAMLEEIDNVGMFDTAVEQQSKIFVSTELGGGGSATARSIAIAKKGIRNFLIHAGILEGEMDIAPSIDLDITGEASFLFAEHDGLFEPLADLGENVEKGDRVAQIWPIDRTGVRPIAYHARRNGLITGRHFPGLIKTGDCMTVIGTVL